MGKLSPAQQKVVDHIREHHTATIIDSDRGIYCEDLGDKYLTINRNVFNALHARGYFRCDGSEGWPSSAILYSFVDKEGTHGTR